MWERWIPFFPSTYRTKLLPGEESKRAWVGFSHWFSPATVVLSPEPPAPKLERAECQHQNGVFHLECIPRCLCACGPANGGLSDAKAHVPPVASASGASAPAACRKRCHPVLCTSLACALQPVVRSIDLFPPYKSHPIPVGVRRQETGLVN